MNYVCSECKREGLKEEEVDFQPRLTDMFPGGHGSWICKKCNNAVLHTCFLCGMTGIESKECYTYTIETPDVGLRAVAICACCKGADKELEEVVI